MGSVLLNRTLGLLPETLFQQQETTRLLHALNSSKTRFVRANATSHSQDRLAEGAEDLSLRVHFGGTSCITIDREEGRYLLSGGADGTISIWDLTNYENTSPRIHHPLGLITKAVPGCHKHGVTAVQFFPSHFKAFTTSSYDHTLKVWSSKTLQAEASFDLGSVVYSHASSPVAYRRVIACATQHPQIRLVDLRSKSHAQSMPGHYSAVMHLAWSPKDEHVLASGGTDGTIRFWDVRRSAPQLGCLDMEDNVGVGGYDGLGTGARHRQRGKAHLGPVNGLVWTDDGRHLVSTGHDEKIRVWDVITGANTLASFGPSVRNRELRTCVPCLPSPKLVQHGKEALFFPNDREITMYEMFDGKLLKRLRMIESGGMPATGQLAGQRRRVNELAWRHHNIELYSAHGDGSIRVWMPYTREDALADDDENEEVRREQERKKNKRKALEDVYNDLRKKQMI